MSWFAESELTAISYFAGPGAGLLDITLGVIVIVIVIIIHFNKFLHIHHELARIITFAGQKKSL